jgi:transcriptional regulator with XRE-family HTH domain
MNKRNVSGGSAVERHSAELREADMSWGDYVAKVIGADRQSDVARKTGIDQTTISRWLSRSPRSERRISSQSVAAFARGYGRPVLEAFVAAEFLSPEEAGLKIDPKTLVVTDLTKVDADDLVKELRRRMSS